MQVLIGILVLSFLSYETLSHLANKGVLHGDSDEVRERRVILETESRLNSMYGNGVRKYIILHRFWKNALSGTDGRYYEITERDDR